MRTELTHQFIKTRKKNFLFILENTATKRKENPSFILIIKMYSKFSLLAPSLRQQLVLVPCL